MSNKPTTLIDGNQINTGEGLSTDPITGKLAVNTSGIKEVIGMGDLGRLNSAPISKGGTGSSGANQARKNLSLGTAANYNVGTAPGNVPVIGENGSLAAKEMVTGTSSKLTDSAVILNGDTVVTTPKAVTSLQIAPIVALSGTSTDPATISDINSKINEINTAITAINSVLSALASHHKLIK